MLLAAPSSTGCQRRASSSPEQIEAKRVLTERLELATARPSADAGPRSNSRSRTCSTTSRARCTSGPALERGPARCSPIPRPRIGCPSATGYALAAKQM